MSTNNWEVLNREQVPRSYIEASEVDRRLLKNVPLRKKWVLNVGSGCYYITENYLLDRGAIVTSLDINEGLLKELYKNIKFKKNFQFVVGDARNLPFEDDRFEVVTSFSTIEHIKDMTEKSLAIKEMARVLKPGGYLVITVPNKLFVPGTLFNKLFTKRTGEYEYRYWPSELRQEMEKYKIKTLKFDSENPKTLDGAIYRERLPKVFKYVPKLLLELLLRLFSHNVFKYYRCRMGYIGKKK